MLFLSGCIAENPDLPIDSVKPLEDTLTDEPFTDEPSTILEVAVLGEYTCSNDMYYNSEFYITHPDAIPSITFYDDGSCKFIINYSEGICNVEGYYCIDEDYIYIGLELSNTIFLDKETGEKYMDDQYVFTIVNSDTIVIDKDCYAVYAGDSFVRLDRQGDDSY
jgi:hypothetical protein